MPRGIPGGLPASLVLHQPSLIPRGSKAPLTGCWAALSRGLAVASGLWPRPPHTQEGGQPATHPGLGTASILWETNCSSDPPHSRRRTGPEGLSGLPCLSPEGPSSPRAALAVRHLLLSQRKDEKHYRGSSQGTKNFPEPGMHPPGGRRVYT